MENSCSSLTLVEFLLRYANLSLIVTCSDLQPCLHVKLSMLAFCDGNYWGVGKFMMYTCGFHVSQEQQFSIADKQNYEEMPDKSERLLCGSQLQPGDEV